MEIKGFDLIGFDLFGVDLNSIDINTDNSVSVKESYIPTTQSPYIKGHITTSDSTFTFKVNNTSTSVSVNANGDFKYKPTTTITQLDFVGVPELESLELYKINGVTTFNVDYPTEVTFKKCDTTTQSSKVDVYHIRGTATSDFTFTLKYIDDNNTVTTVTESAVIDGNGKWDVAYSGKKIYSLEETFKGTMGLLSVEMQELDECVSGYNAFYQANDLEYINLGICDGSKLTDARYMFRTYYSGTQKDMTLVLPTNFAPTNMNNTFYRYQPKNGTPLPKEIFINATNIQSCFGGMKADSVDLSLMTKVKNFEYGFWWYRSEVPTVVMPPIESDFTFNTTYNFFGSSNVNISFTSYIKCSIPFSGCNKLSEQSIVNIFNAIAVNNITMTFHSTIGAYIDDQLEIEDSPIYNAYWNKFDDGIEINYTY